MPIYALHDRKPILPPNGAYWIAPTASVIGDVVLGEDCGVWFGATLRGDNERIAIGARSIFKKARPFTPTWGSPSRSARIARSDTMRSCTAARSGTGRWSAWARSCSTAPASARLPDRRQRPRHGRQAVPRRLFDRRQSRQGGPDPRRGRHRRPPQIGGQLCQELAPVRGRTRRNCAGVSDTKK